MATRPGGQKSISAALDFMVQLQGIGGAIAELGGLTDKAKGFNQGLLDFGVSSKSSSNQITNGFRAQSVYLEKTYAHWVDLNKERFRELETLKEARKNGELPEDQKNRLSNLEEELDFRKQLVPQLQRANEETNEMFQIMDIIGSAGVAGIGLLSNAIGGTASDIAEVTDGLNIMQDSIGAGLGAFKKLWKLSMGGQNEEGMGQTQETLAGAAEAMVIPELRVKTLRFKEAVGPEEISKVDGAKKDLLKDKGAGGLKDRVTGKVGKIGDKMSKMGAKLQGAGGKLQGFSTKLTGMGKAGKVAGPALGKIGAGMSKVGMGLSKAGPALSGFVASIGAIPGIGPIIVVAIVAIASAFIAAAAAARFLKKGLQLVVANMEAYRLVNYRALGSMRELLDATYDVSMATGLSNKQSMEAIKALSHVGITAGELTKAYGNSGEALRDLAVMQGQFTRMTGASATSIAQLQKRLMVGGVSMKNMQRTLDRTSMTMRKFGLEGKDADAVMNVLSTNLMDLNAVYGESDINEYVDTMTELGAAAKRAGVDVGRALSQINADLRKMKGGAATLMALGGSFNELVEGGAKAGNLSNLVGGYEKTLKMIEGMPKGLQDVALTQMGITGEMRAMLDAEKERRDVLTASYEAKGMSHEQAIKAMEAELALETQTADLRQKAMDDYQGSVNTLTQQLQDMFVPLQAEAAKAMMPFVEGLIEAVKLVAPVIKDMVGNAMEYIMAAGDVLYRIFDVLSPVLAVIGKAIQWIVGLLFKIGTVGFKLVSASLSLLKPFVFVLKLIAAVIIGIGEVVYQVFGGILDAIGWLLDGFSWIFDTIFDFGGAMSALAEFFQPVLDVFNELGALVGEVFDAMWGVIKPFWDGIKEAFTALWPIIKVVGAVLLAVFVPVLAPIIVVIGALKVLMMIFSKLAQGIRWVKEAMFGSSFLHIAEGVGEVSGPLEMLINGFKMLAAPIQFATMLLGGMFKAGKAAIGAVYGAVTAPFKAIGKMAKGAWDSVTGVVGNIGESISGVVEGIGTSLDSTWNSVTSMLDSGMGDTIGSLKKEAGAVLETVGEALSGLWNSIFGSDDEPVSKAGKLAGGVVAGLPEGMRDAALVQASTPMYTSKFDDDTKRSGKERSAELVVLQQETVALLSKILEKNDPDNKRAAEAMEKIADKASESLQPDVFRSRKGFGEHVTQWWISK